jgi:hypothetical protein
MESLVLLLMLFALSTSHQQAKAVLFLLLDDVGWSFQLVRLCHLVLCCCLFSKSSGAERY